MTEKTMNEWSTKAGSGTPLTQLRSGDVQAQLIPWGVSTIGCMYHPDVGAGLPDGRYVAAVAEPYHCNFVEAIRAAWWVFTGRAHAVIWPDDGDLEAIWTRDNPTLRDQPLPFMPRKSR